MTDTTSPTPAEHTALPWHFDATESYLMGPEGERICQGPNHQENRTRWPEDARRIETAVNERPMLLSRIRELEEALLLADHALDYYASTFSGRTDLAAHSAVRSALQPAQEETK
jgi:hypothetical protein